LKTDEPTAAADERAAPSGGNDAASGSPSSSPSSRKREGGAAPLAEAQAQDATEHERWEHDNGAPSRSPGVGSRVPPQPLGSSLPGRGSADELPQARRSRTLRYLYWGVWFIALPITLSAALVWALSPPSGAELSSGFGAIQGLVRGQPVPVGIVLFTVFEIILWAARHQLPFASHAHAPMRPDLPVQLRGSFERSRALLDEAETILARHEKAIVRDLSAKERERVHDHLQVLKEAMARVPFDEQGFVDALAQADDEVDTHLGRWRKSEVREYLEAILLAIGVAFALRAFVIEAFKIPSGSMIPTLMVGDHIFVNKFSYGPAIPFTHARVWTNMPPHRGDVIVFAFPEQPDQDFIKRVIVVPGDKLEARNGHPIINGWEVPSCDVGPWSYSEFEQSMSRHEGELFVEYLGSETFLTFYDRVNHPYPDEYQGPFYAKPGEVWVMGDNRNNSHDSRMWFRGAGGGVPFENIRGRALFVWLSMSDNGVDASREGAPVMGRPRLPPSASQLEGRFEECLKNRPAVTSPP
jgi:signal peptidase I